jgi:hypothetical protein
VEDENFAKAVKDTGRRKVIVAGVTNDVGTVYPVLTPALTASCNGARPGERSTVNAAAP